MSGHIFLVGFMGAGKSTVGRVVAARLGMPFLDLDDRIEQSAGMTVTQIFSTRGEDGFRELETAALEGLADVAPSVIACGGGVVLRTRNRASLKRLGRVVYLEVTAGEAVARIGDASTRPLLSGPGGTLAATALLSAREGLYRSVADVTVATVGRTPDGIADEIVAAVEAGA